MHELGASERTSDKPIENRVFSIESEAMSVFQFTRKDQICVIAVGVLFCGLNNHSDKRARHGCDDFIVLTSTQSVEKVAVIKAYFDIVAFFFDLNIIVYASVLGITGNIKAVILEFTSQGSTELFINEKARSFRTFNKCRTVDSRENTVWVGSARL